MTGAGLSCLEILARFAAVLLLCVSVVCVAFDPYSEVAVIVSMDEAADLADSVTPTPPDPDDAPVRLASEQAPEFRFVDLCAERSEPTLNWRFICVFEARGPPV